MVLDQEEQKTYYHQILHLVEVEQDFNNMVNVTTKHRDGMKKIDRLLEPRVSTEEMNLPDQPEPRLDSDYIDRHLMCLPEKLHRNIRQQGVKKRQRRIESYCVNTYGYIPPRVRRLISGSYRPSLKGLPALRRTAKSDARRRYIQHLSASSASASSASPSSSISTPP